MIVALFSVIWRPKITEIRATIFADAGPAPRNVGRSTTASAVTEPMVDLPHPAPLSGCAPVAENAAITTQAATSSRAGRGRLKGRYRCPLRRFRATARVPHPVSVAHTTFPGNGRQRQRRARIRR